MVPGDGSQENDDQEYSRKIAELIVDALLDAKIIRKDDFERAVSIAAEEILVRRSMGDR